MDELDYRILEVLQSEFPLIENPYEAISEKLSIPCDTLMDRVKALLEDGVIRRLGASLNSHKFGYTSTLAAISVEKGIVDQASEIIKSFPEITHSYQRSDKFNIWFTIIASDNQKIKNIIEKIQSYLSLDNSQILNLPMKQLFKLNASFKILS